MPSFGKPIIRSPIFHDAILYNAYHMRLPTRQQPQSKMEDEVARNKIRENGARKRHG